MPDGYVDGPQSKYFCGLEWVAWAECRKWHTCVDKGKGRGKTEEVASPSTVPPVTQPSVAADAPRMDRGLLLIGLFKVAKAVFFIAVAAGAMHFIHHDLGQALDRLVGMFNLDTENRFVSLVLGKADLVTHHRIRQFSMLSVGYALLCLCEGYGLLRRRVWAEYLTLWLSTAFVPWELWELIRHPQIWRVAIPVVNLLIVAYLVWLLRRKRRCSETGV